MNEFLIIAVAGVLACVVLDAFGRALLIVLKVPEPAYGILGRWVFFMIKRGHVFNPTISASAPISHELKIGWIFHYLISIAWAVLFYFLFFVIQIAEVSYVNGLIFGAATTIAPLFIFMPLTGQGVLASNTPRPLFTSLILLARHSIFGLAMFAAFNWLN